MDKNEIKLDGETQMAQQFWTVQISDTCPLCVFCNRPIARKEKYVYTCMTNNVTAATCKECAEEREER
ncbi:MAG: hypothetical protein ACNYVW_05225 [Methanosarcinales archaeon]